MVERREGGTEGGRKEGRGREEEREGWMKAVNGRREEERRQD